MTSITKITDPNSCDAIYWSVILDNRWMEFIPVSVNVSQHGLYAVDGDITEPETPVPFFYVQLITNCIIILATVLFINNLL